MMCADCRMLLLDYEHGALGAAEDAALHVHLQECAECRARRQEDIELTDALRGALGQELDFPTSIIAGVRQAMHPSPAPTLVERWKAALAPSVWAPASAALVVAAVGITWFAQPRSAEVPAFSTSYYVQQHVAHTFGSPSHDRAWSAYLLTSANAAHASPSEPRT